MNYNLQTCKRIIFFFSFLFFFPQTGLSLPCSQWWYFDGIMPRREGIAIIEDAKFIPHQTKGNVYKSYKEAILCFWKDVMQ